MNFACSDKASQARVSSFDFCKRHFWGYLVGGDASHLQKTKHLQTWHLFKKKKNRDCCDEQVFMA